MALPDDPGADLAGKSAIVTGASREIGIAMAAALARRGAAVMLAHHAEATLADAAVARIRAAGGVALAHECDGRSVEANRAMVARAVAELGPLAVFAANAGVTVWGPFLEADETDWDLVADVNLKGSFFGAQAAARAMIAQAAPGTIVLSSSIAGVRAIPYLAAYGTTKAALRHLARSLAVELGPHRISVNALGIGPTVNARNLADDPEYERHWSAISPAGRAAQPEDAARAVLYLVDNPYVTGTTLMIDGGWTLQSPPPPLDFVVTKR